jgi:hypothetical protein
VSFEGVSWLLQKLLAGAERVPRESERHTKEYDSFAAGGALLYVKEGARRDRRFWGCGAQQEGAKRPSVPFPRVGP